MENKIVHFPLRRLFAFSKRYTNGFIGNFKNKIQENLSSHSGREYKFGGAYLLYSIDLEVNIQYRYSIYY
jgi:hypothetical protein